MTKTLHHGHGTALIIYINRNILAAVNPTGSGLETPTLPLQTGSRLCIAFALHLLQKPITCAAMVEAGGGTATAVNDTLSHLVREGIFDMTMQRSATGGRLHSYAFTEDFAEQLDAINSDRPTTH